jgi:hypothetical protein
MDAVLKLTAEEDPFKMVIGQWAFLHQECIDSDIASLPVSTSDLLTSMFCSSEDVGAGLERTILETIEEEDAKEYIKEYVTKPLSSEASKAIASQSQEHHGMQVPTISSARAPHSSAGADPGAVFPLVAVDGIPSFQNLMRAVKIHDKHHPTADTFLRDFASAVDQHLQEQANQVNDLRSRLDASQEQLASLTLDNMQDLVDS